VEQLLRFAIVGGLNSAITYGIFLFFLGLGFHYQVALFFEYCFGITLGYFLNSHWTFGRQKNTSTTADASSAGLPSFVRYATTYLGVYLANVILLSVVVESGVMCPAFTSFGVYLVHATSLSVSVDPGRMCPAIGQIVVLGAISFANFFIQKYWVFGKKEVSTKP
jgi:putative flippase GtrA